MNGDSRKLFEEFKRLLSTYVRAELDRAAFLEKFDRNSCFLVDSVDVSRKKLFEFVLNLLEEREKLNRKADGWKE